MKSFKKLAVEIAELAYDKKCENIILLDVKKLSGICDFFVICTVNSESQLSSVRDTVEDYASKEYGIQKYSRESVSPNWQTIDLAGIVVHLMTPSAREFYALESIWHKARKINWHDKD